MLCCLVTLGYVLRCYHLTRSLKRYAVQFVARLCYTPLFFLCVPIIRSSARFVMLHLAPLCYAPLCFAMLCNAIVWVLLSSAVMCFALRFCGLMSYAVLCHVSMRLCMVPYDSRRYTSWCVTSMSYATLQHGGLISLTMLSVWFLPATLSWDGFIMSPSYVLLCHLALLCYAMLCSDSALTSRTSLSVGIVSDPLLCETSRCLP